MQTIKKIVTVVALILFTATGYVWVVNINSKNMTIRQQVLKAIYPLIMGAGKIFGKNASIENTSVVKPAHPIYELSFELNNGQVQPMSAFKGKKVLIVNTASDCGYSGQFDELQELQDQFSSSLVVLGFPANDFKEQEQNSDEAIAAFCKINYGVKFPLSKKTVVIPSANQHPVFSWLSKASLNGWCNQPPVWNFSKYLINEEGVLTHFFDTKTSPLSTAVLNAVKE